MVDYLYRVPFLSYRRYGSATSYRPYRTYHAHQRRLRGEPAQYVSILTPS